MATVAGNPESTFSTTMAATFIRAWNPVAFGAVMGDTRDAGIAAVNDAAFAACWDACFAAGGGRIHIPAGTWVVNEWRIDVAGAVKSDRTVNLHIDAPGAVLLGMPPNGTTTASGDPVLWVGASDSEHSDMLLRQVKITGLSVQGDPAPIDSGTWIDRAGMYFFNVQELTLEKTWVSFFKWAGMTFDGVMDSTVFDSMVGWCGDSRYAAVITTTGDTNANAIRFVGFHIENCGLMLDVTGPSRAYSTRHIQFIGSKFERRSTNWTENSPIRFGHCLEIDFDACLFVINKFEKIGEQITPAFLSSSEDTAGADRGGRKRVRFRGCDFATPSNTSARWIGGPANTAGHHMAFETCTFHSAVGIDPWGAAFRLGHGTVMRDCQIIVAATLENPAVTPIGDVFAFDGYGAQVIDPIIYCPPGLTGTLLTVTANAEACAFTGWRDDAPGGKPTALLMLPSGESQLSTRLRVDELTQRGMPVQSAPTPSVFGRYHVILGAGPYTGFLHAYAGQQIVITPADSQSFTLTHSGGLRLAGHVSRTITWGNSIALVYSHAGYWRET